MSPIRVLVADMVALDHDIVGRIMEARLDLTVVGRVDGPTEAARVLVARSVDVLLLSASGPGPLFSYLVPLWRHLRLAVVVVDPRDERGLVRVFRVVEQVGGAGADWSDNLVAAIRLAAGEPRAD